MPPDLRSMLNESEAVLLREVDSLDQLDEDGLIVLHDRIRRARNKYSKLYRRRARAQVAADATRGRAHDAHARSIAKAELFEDALARVSRKLAAEAKAAAAALKKERLEAARQGSATRPSASRGKAPASTGTPRSTAKRSTRTPSTEKTRASSKATTKRKQAAKDTRSKR